MVLYLIGLGLGDEKDITVKGLEKVRDAEFVFLEEYTSRLAVDKEQLENFYNKKITLADRDLIERRIEREILVLAKSKKVALLIVGDPFGATTHTDLMLRAAQLGIEVEVVHNASVLNAVGVIGLELYKYGRTTSIPFWEKNFEPEVFYDVIKENRARGLHTLCLLDIKSDQDRFMTVQQALELLQKVEERRGEQVIGPHTLMIGVARLGQPDQQIVAAGMHELATVDFGSPLHCLIVPGALQIVEEEALERWFIKE